MAWVTLKQGPLGSGFKSPPVHYLKSKMKKIILSLFIVLLLIGCTKPRVDEDRGYLQDQLSVKFKDAVPKDEVTSIIEERNLKILKENQNNVYIVQIPKEKNINNTKKEFESMKQVQYASVIRQVQIVF